MQTGIFSFSRLNSKLAIAGFKCLKTETFLATVTFSVQLENKLITVQSFFCRLLPSVVFLNFANAINCACLPHTLATGVVNSLKGSFNNYVAKMRWVGGQ